MNSVRLLCAVVTSASFLDATAQDLAAPAVDAAPRASISLDYRSAFEGYRRYREPVPRTWRETNEEAGLLGGHRGQLTPATPAAASPTLPKPAGAAHEGHAK